MFDDEDGTEFLGGNLSLRRGDVYYQEFIKIYRHISSWDINWTTELESIPQATDEQIRNLIEEKDGFPKVQMALKRMLKGEGPYFKLVLEDNVNKKLGHVILAYGLRSGTRKDFICEFQQCSHINIWGVFTTLGVSALVLVVTKNPAYALMPLFSKFAADYYATTKDVAIVAAIKFLENNGLIRIIDDGEHLRILLP